MNEWIVANWPLVAAALAVLVLVLGWLILASRRTRIERVEANDEAGPAQRNQALIDAPPAATQPVAAPVAVAVPEAAAAPQLAPASDSEIGRLKGVGPKLVAQLGEMGVTSLAQVAAWDEAEIDRIDAQLGRFAGRIRRDNWVEQAQLLESGDRAAYESRFGKG